MGYTRIKWANMVTIWGLAEFRKIRAQVNGLFVLVVESVEPGQAASSDPTNHINPKPSTLNPKP